MISDSLQDHIRPITELQPDPANARKHSERNIEAIMASLTRFGQVKPVVLGSNGQTVIAGNGTLEAAKRLGWTELAAVTTELAGSEATAFGIADNQTALLAEWDDDILQNLVHGLPDELQTATGFDSDEIDRMVQAATEDPAGTLPSLEVAPSLSDRFLIPPFSVMNTGKAWWQDRKRQWISQGINSELGREAGLAFENVNALDPRLYEKKTEKEKELGRSLTTAEYVEHYWDRPTDAFCQGTSIFDPVLAEVLVRWFSGDGHSILDPCAGGSVRGIISGMLGREYLGVDIRDEQVQANKTQAAQIDSACTPSWVVGDGRKVQELTTKRDYDMLLTCPPYADLEVYSDRPDDLSTMPYPEFLEGYREMIAQACGCLAMDTFACIVVGEVRDKRTGIYRSFVPDTIRAFEDAGLGFYNEAILVNTTANAILAPRRMNSTRKLVKNHQNVLIFVKGDGKKATTKCGEITIDPTLLEDDDGQTTTGDR